MPTLVVDAGENIVGILSVGDSEYSAYQGGDIALALRLIVDSEEVVTYNGTNYDLQRLGQFAALPAGQELNLKGKHTDMRSICWSNRIWGSSLIDTYLMHFMECPSFADSYVGSNERDCYMTLKLWELWKLGKLKVIDGNIHSSGIK